MLDPLFAWLRQWSAQWLTAGLWFEIAVILLSGALAALVHHRWHRYLDSRLGEHEQRGFTRAALRGSVRVVFPFVMLVLLLAGRGVLKEFQQPIHLLHVFVPLLLSLAAIRLIVYILRRGSTPSPALRAWEGVISTSIWGIVALHLLGWLPGILAAIDSIAITAGDTRISLLSVAKTLLAIALFMVLANWLSAAIERNVRRSPYFSSSMRVGITKISKFTLYALAILIGLYSVGIDLTALTVFGGALGVGIGFGLQRIASNFISGFILLFDRSIRPGDVISINGQFGWVEALQARYIVVRDRDGVETLIPNENLITSEVINWSYSDRHIRIKLPVQISYADDPEHAMQLLVEAAGVCARVMADPPAQARLIGFGDSGIDLELRIWLSDPELGVGNVRSEINLEIWRLFKAHGITIPFPQRDVRMRPVAADPAD